MGQLSDFTLTSAQLVAALARLEGGEPLPLRTLAYWAAAGILRPSVAYVGRRGRYGARLYSRADLVKARLVLRLRRRGVSMPRVRAVLAYVARQLPAALVPGSRAELVIDGKRAWLTAPDSTAVEVTPAAGQLSLPLSQLFRGVAAALRDARAVA